MVLGNTSDKGILLTGHIPYIPPFPDQYLWLSHSYLLRLLLEMACRL